MANGLSMPLYQHVLKWCGILPTYSDHIWYRVYSVTSWINVIFLEYGFIVALYYNINNLTKSCQILSGAIGILLGITKASIFIFNRSALKSTIVKIQENIDRSILDHHSQHYENMHSAAEKYAKIYMISMTIATILLGLGPIASVIFDYLSGAADVANFRFPCEVMYHRQDLSITEYLFIYLIFLFGLCYGAAYEVAGDGSFIAMNLHLVAAYMELADKFNEMNENLRMKKNRIPSEAEAKQNLVICVDFHRYLLNLLGSVRTLFNPIIFVQFLLSSIQMTAVLVELIMHETIKADRALAILSSAPPILVMLFIYCKFGNDLTVQAAQLPQELYNTEWYNYPQKIKKLLPIVLQRSGKPELMNGFKFFSCTLQSYTQALNRVASLLAVLRQFLQK